MKRQQIKRQLVEESIEAKPLNATSEFRDMGEGILKSAWKDLLLGSANTIPEQLLGSSSRSEEYLEEGNIVSLEKYKKSKEKNTQATSEHMEYFRTVKSADIISERNVEHEIKQQVEQIRIEIKRLAVTVKEVDRTVREANVENTPAKPGKYHLSFFEFVLSTIKDATRKLEDSVSFGAIFSIFTYAEVVSCVPFF